MPTEFYYGFLVFAFVGIIEVGLVLFRIFNYQNEKQVKRSLKQHLDDAYEAGEVTEDFYNEHLDRLDEEL